MLLENLTDGQPRHEEARPSNGKEGSSLAGQATERELEVWHTDTVCLYRSTDGQASDAAIMTFSAQVWAGLKSAHNTARHTYISRQVI